MSDWFYISAAIIFLAFCGLIVGVAWAEAWAQRKKCEKTKEKDKT